ncbi:MAG: SH3 domain-containing protein [Synergistaceae bacterium]|nr:SH3 domain-containing protein [Synergistaceae bacterium]
MRRGHIKRPRRRIFPLRIIIPLVFLIIGVGVAYSLVTGERTPDPRPEPIIIRPNQPDPISNNGEYNTVEVVTLDPLSPDVIIQLINPDPGPGPGTDEGQDQFTSARVAAYTVNSAELRRTVDQYANNRANQCAGEVTVVTDDTPLNIRSGPSTASTRLTRVPRGSRYNVLLWARDGENQSRRWFLLVNEQTKAVMGWARSDFLNTGNVVFAN